MLDLLIAIISATAGQILLSQHDLRGLIPVALAILVLLTAPRRVEPQEKVVGGQAGSGRSFHSKPASWIRQGQDRSLRLLLLPIASANAVLAILGAADNTYRLHGVAAWLFAVGLFLAIFWEREPGRSVLEKLGLNRNGWRLTWTALAVIGLVLIGLWFRVWRLDEMPSEMTSDHVEKLLDVHDLDTGQRPIFFVRNTGREPWQFYWTLMFIRLFGLGTQFFALKLGTAAVGLLMLPGVYLLGRDLFGRRVGLWALLFAAVGSWSVILNRVGLRFPFAPAATAWSLLYLLRGLRDGRRNDFLLLGLWLGIGLQGYTAFRAMPLAVVFCWVLAWVLRPSSFAIQRSSLVRNAVLTVFIALVVFIPVGRFSIEHPDDFWRRSFSRVADPNQAMPDGPFPTFIKNLGNLALMFNWKGDDVWVNTLVDAPVLDPLLGGLFILGLAMVLWRGLRLRDPIGPLLLIACVILLLPSALSLAYPIENPSVVRTGGAIPAVMVIAALPVGLGLKRGRRAPDATQHSEQHDPRGKTLERWRGAMPVLIASALAITVTAVNYQRYFVDYWQQYHRNALNTTEIASAIHGFIESGGDTANAWIVAWPYWIDTRGVGIELGDPPWNNVILEGSVLNDHADLLTAGSADGASPRFYVLHPDDEQTLDRLRTLFPQGWSSLYTPEHPYRDFVLYYVPRTLRQSLMQGLKGTTADAP